MEKSTEMLTLVEFLRARLDEDEQAARAANEGPWKIARSRRAEDDEMAILSGESEIVGAGYEGGGVWAKEDAEHIARHDPARVLRKVEATRRIIDYILREDDRDDNPYWYGDAIWRILEMLALPDADHPDYREEWRP